MNSNRDMNKERDRNRDDCMCLWDRCITTPNSHLS